VTDRKVFPGAHKDKSAQKRLVMVCGVVYDSRELSRVTTVWSEVAGVLQGDMEKGVITLVVFNGEDFGYWKNRTRNYLLSQDVLFGRSYK
jgi:hypothetical protein